MSTDCCNRGDDKTGSGPSTPGMSNEDDTSTAEEHELLRDHLHHEFEFEEAGQEEASEHNDDSSDSGTDEDMPTMVGRMKDNASSNDSSSSGSYPYHTDNDNSNIEDSDDDCSAVPGLQERCRDDSSSDDSVSCQEENVHSSTAT